MTTPAETSEQPAARTSTTPSGQGRRSWLPLAGLLVAHAISLTGNVLTMVAVPLYVLAQTHSAARTGLAGVAATVPVVLGGVLGGTVVDRIGHRRASVLSDLGAGLTMAVVPVLGHLVDLPYGALLALVFTSGLLDAPAQIARTSLLPEAARIAGVPIERAVGWMGAIERMSKLLGAPLAGLMVALAGALNVLALDAGSFLLSATVVTLLVVRLTPAGASVVSPATAPATPPTAGRLGRYRAELAEGLRFLLGDRLLRAIVLMIVLTNAFDAGNSTVLLPVYAQRELGGAVAFGLLIGAAGGGALAGSLVYGAVGHRLPRRLTYTVSFLLAGGPAYFAFAAGLPLSALLVVKALAGFSAGALNPMISVILLERVPVGLRARVFGLTNLSWAAMPVGSVAAGFAVDRVGLAPTFLVIGSAYLVVSLSPLFGGAWRGLDRPAAADST